MLRNKTVSFLSAFFPDHDSQRHPLESPLVSYVVLDEPSDARAYGLGIIHKEHNPGRPYTGLGCIVYLYGFALVGGRG